MNDITESDIEDVLMSMELRELVQATLSWAEDRGIFDFDQGASVFKQHDKLIEEVMELRDTLVIRGQLLRVSEWGSEAIGDANSEVKKELGDCIVVLIMIAELMNTSLEECLHMAYDKIKDRKGRMINGKFVKEEDL